MSTFYLQMPLLSEPNHHQIQCRQINMFCLCYLTVMTPEILLYDMIPRWPFRSVSKCWWKEENFAKSTWPTSRICDSDSKSLITQEIFKKLISHFLNSTVSADGLTLLRAKDIFRDGDDQVQVLYLYRMWILDFEFLRKQHISLCKGIGMIIFPSIMNI